MKPLSSPGLPVALLMACLLGALPDPGVAQEAPPAARDTTVEPEMAKAPLQFRLSATAGAFLWGEKEGVVSLANLANFGIDIESRIVPAFAVRFGASYGSTTASDDTASIGVNQWEFGVQFVGRVAVAPFTKAGFVPYGFVGAGAISLDPRTDPNNPAEDDLITRSQSAFALGGGIDIEPGSGRWGGRVEYRHYRVSLEDPFDPVDRTSDTLGADAIIASIYWKL
jgi:opacity protein-like surface antigen